MKHLLQVVMEIEEGIFSSLNFASELYGIKVIGESGSGKSTLSLNFASELYGIKGGFTLMEKIIY